MRAIAADVARNVCVSMSVLSTTVSPADTVEFHGVGGVNWAFNIDSVKK